MTPVAHKIYVDRMEKRIRNITMPDSGANFGQLFSDTLVRRIAEEVVDEIEKTAAEGRA